VYPRLALMQQVAEEVTLRYALPFFTGVVIRDESLRERLLRFHRALAENTPSLSVESTLIDALAHLIQRYSDDRRSRSCGLNERTAVQRAREYIDAHYDADVSLSELATLVHLSPFYFARAFQREVGLPPHAHLENVRVKRARELLLGGVPITDVFAAVGYADQSHLTNRFKRLLGMTPGQVARNREMAGR
jgi:AraC-like DNA-binding protein